MGEGTAQNYSRGANSNSASEVTETYVGNKGEGSRGRARSGGSHKLGGTRVGLMYKVGEGKKTGRRQTIFDERVQFTLPFQIPKRKGDYLEGGSKTVTGA